MRILSIIFLCLTLLGCSAYEHRDWLFMQSVGGLTVARQDKNPSWLILRGDISGLKEFSNKPTQVNSALALKKVESIIQDSTIQIYVVTTLVTDTNRNTEITGVSISGAKKGTYMVQYRNPDGTTVDLKEIVLNVGSISNLWSRTEISAVLFEKLFTILNLSTPPLRSVRYTEKMKPIETKYNGLRFRSRLEARWAVLFDNLKLKYQYEPEAFEIEGLHYLPDFYLPSLDLFVEIKPKDPPEEEFKKVFAFSSHKEMLLLVGTPYAEFDKYGHGTRLDYVGEYFAPMPESERTLDSDTHIISRSPTVFIQCRYCENIGIESRGFHFNDLYPDDLHEHGGFHGFCCSEKAGVASSKKLVNAYEEAKSYVFWQ